MSADIYIHPRTGWELAQLAALYRTRGYLLVSTKRGHIKAQPIPVLRNVVVMPKRRT